MTFAQCAFIHAGLQRTLLCQTDPTAPPAGWRPQSQLRPVFSEHEACSGGGPSCLLSAGFQTRILLIILDFIRETGTRIHARVQQHLLKKPKKNQKTTTHKTLVLHRCLPLTGQSVLLTIWLNFSSRAWEVMRGRPLSRGEPSTRLFIGVGGT